MKASHKSKVPSAMNTERTAAYFSMEIGINENLLSCNGGLGILAGDTIRSAADLKVPMVIVTPSRRSE